MSRSIAAIVPAAIGSLDHRRLLAKFFIDSHVHYAPEAIAWPTLTEPDRARLAKLPFWQEAISTENVTSNTVTAAAALESDRELKEAIELQGLEERRHAQLLQCLTSHYRIEVSSPAPFVSQRLEHDFLFAGFGECFDSFFAFGLFALARDSGYFPAALVDIFEPVVQEEARHILFFVNWVKYRRLQLPWWRRTAFRARCAWIILKQIASRVETARNLGSTETPSDNFTLSAHQDLAADVTLHRLLELCLSENARRLHDYDARLHRPRLVPTVARVLYRVLPARW